MSVDDSRRRRPAFGALLCGIAIAGLLLGGLVLALVLHAGQPRQLVGQTEGNLAPPAVFSSSTAQEQQVEVSGASAPREQVLQGPCADKAAHVAPSDLELCYRWKNGQQYAYRISCRAEIEGTVLEATGSTTYTVGRPPSALRAASEAKPGSGTAFVVSPDGYLITCDHVVRDATDIKVTLGDQTSPCRVVATDSAHDVALLRIARRGLAALPLADSETVELAEEVRAVGYPLSDVLGSSIKVTQGSVAGIVSKPRDKVFQIDAVVNPGNSGGPLLDARGAVIGVVNAQLVGVQISKVGFAVPVNYAKSLLTQNHVAFPTAAGDKLDGPALAKRVSPSVGLVTMMAHGGDAPEQQRPTLYYHGVLDYCKPPPPNLPGVTFPADSSSRDDGTLVVDECGAISEFKGRANLPCLLGRLGAVAIDALPANAEKTWKREETSTIAVAARGWNDPLAGIHPAGFLVDHTRPPPRPLFWADDEPERNYSTKLQVAYSRDEPQGSTLVIHKRLELKSLDGPDVNPTLELSGSGDTIFDLHLGMPQKVTFSGTFTLRENGRNLVVPVTFQCEWIPGGGPTEMASETSKPEAGAAPAEQLGAAERAKAQLDAFLADLRAQNEDWAKRFEALQGLAMLAPIPSRREEVAAVLDRYLAEKNYSARSSAVRAVQIWGTPRNVPALILLLNPSENDSIRRKAIEALGILGDTRAAPPIAQRLKEPADRPAAIRALRALGRPGEDAALALLADSDPETLAGVYQALSQIGSSKSAGTLKERADRGDTAAKAALDKLMKEQQ
jgi:S1-C subfamily serine protease